VKIARAGGRDSRRIGGGGEHSRRNRGEDGRKKSCKEDAVGELTMYIYTYIHIYTTRESREAAAGFHFQLLLFSKLNLSDHSWRIL